MVSPSVVAIELVIFSSMIEVLFAIWARMYSKAIAKVRSAGGESDAAVELRPVRWMSMTSAVVRLFLLIGINVSGTAFGVLLFVPSFLLYLGLTIIHGQVRFALEREIRKIEASQLDAFKLATRVLAITIGIYVVYYGVYWGGLKALGALSWAAVPIALFVAVFVIYFCSPVIVRMMFPCRQVTDPEIISILTRCFERANLPIPSFWMLDLDRHKSHNAMVSGLRMGRGAFKPALFFTGSLVKELAPDEFEAVILHEVSHISLHHMRGRMAVGVLSVLLSILPMLGLFMFGQYLFQPQQYALAVMCVYLFAIFIQFSAMRWVVRQQELEADANAVVRLGADPSAFARALSKLMRMNDRLDDKKDPSSYLSPASAHPTVVQRVEEVHRRIKLKQMGEDPLPKGEIWEKLVEDWGSPLGSACAVLIAALFYWYVADGKPRTELRRAAEMGDIAAMEDALDRGAAIDGMDVFDGGSTPLIAAVRAGQVPAVQFLLRSGADPNLVLPDRRHALGEVGSRSDLRAILLASGAEEPTMRRVPDRGLASKPDRGKH
jgi:Zn-dependent protease with chaperone function